MSAISILLDLGEVRCQELQLVAHASREVVAQIDVEVADGIVNDLCEISQPFFSFFKRSLLKRNLVSGHLKEYWATHFGGVSDRPILVHANDDASAHFIDEAGWHELSKRLPSSLISNHGYAALPSYERRNDQQVDCESSDCGADDDADKENDSLPTSDRERASIGLACGYLIFRAI